MLYRFVYLGLDLKNAIFIMTDPSSGSDEATSRLLNALGYADECKRHGDNLAIVFAGTGTRGPQELAKLTLPAHAHYNGLRENIQGASRTCAMRNHAVEVVQATGLPLIGDNAIAATQGAASFRRHYAEGWKVSVF